MPEGHTLHRLADDYADHYAGRVTESCSPQGRFTVEAGKITGLALDATQAYGKHLLCRFGEYTVHLHLGLAGKVEFTQGQPPPVVGAVRWRLHAQGITTDVRGPATCELLTPGEIDDLVGKLGPDPLRADADPDRAWQRIRRSAAPIGVLLMDQKVLAGVGNIYRAEVLYRHGLDPLMAGRLLKPAQWQGVWADLVTLMRIGVQTGRIDTLRPEHEPEAMGRPPREDRHGGEVYVYRRSGLPCHVCRRRVRIAVLAGRNLFWCPGCQRRTRRTTSR